MEPLARPTVLLSLVASVHFSISVLLFLSGVVLEYYGHRQDLVWKQWLWESVPAVLLTVLSFGGVVAAWRHRRYALPLVAVLYVAAGLAFSYDVRNKRSQLSVSVASPKYWRGGQALDARRRKLAVPDSAETAGNFGNFRIHQ